ncbi:oxidoreductase [Phlegmacium glaucopus]|nr:oxidoreductase [Phlegmacium glaucopus]
MPRIVLVTGCSTGGIGYSLCEEFARQGCKVYASSRKIDTIADFGDNTIEKISLDVTSDEGVQNALNHIIEKEGKIDVVVNNAGVLSPGPLVEEPLDNVKQIFDTNTYSILRVCKAVVPIMAKRRSGTIVNIGSVVGEISTPWNGLYCASKAAANSISEVLSMELKPFNISVLHVAPGAVKSNISSNGSLRFGLAPDTLYSDFYSNMIERMNMSQSHYSMSTKDFAEQVVSKALQKNPPRYMSIGGHSRVFTLFKWLPRSFVLYYLWRLCSRRT